MAETIYYPVITEIELLSAPHLTDENTATIQSFLARCQRVDLTPDIVASRRHLMTDYVADTHALIWYLEDKATPGPAASAVFDACDRGEATIHIIRHVLDTCLPPC